MPDGRPWDTKLEDDKEFSALLDTRSFRTLREQGFVTTYGELVQSSEQKLLKIVYFGKISLDKVKKHLAHCGLNLGMNLN